MGPGRRRTSPLEAKLVGSLSALALGGAKAPAWRMLGILRDAIEALLSRKPLKFKHAHFSMASHLPRSTHVHFRIGGKMY